MATQKTAASNKGFKKDPLTRSARMKLMRSVDLLISNFEPDAPVHQEPVVDPTHTRLLDRQYQRLSDTAATLNRWHNDSNYLTPTGSPKSVPRVGKVSMTSLALDALGDAVRADQTAADLIEFGLVKKIRDKYAPDKRSAVVGKRSPLILAHATSAVARYIDTVTHNVSGQRPARYERQVADVMIPAKELPQFLRFVEQQGQYFIDAIDDWLSSRMVDSQANGESVSVGVGAFAYAEQPKKTKPPKSSPSTRPRR